MPAETEELKDLPPTGSKEESILDKEVEFLSVVEFLNGMLAKSADFTQHLDTQINIILGITSVVFIFSLTQFFAGSRDFALIVLSGFSAVSSVIALVAVHPPKVVRKSSKDDSLMFNKRIAGFEEFKDYEWELVKVLNKPDKIVNQYAIELYNLSKYYYRPKRDLFNLARNVLLVGLVITTAVYVVEIFGHLITPL